MQGSSETERTPASAPPVTLKTWSRRPPRAVSVWNAPSTNKRLYRMHFARRPRSPTKIPVSFILFVLLLFKAFMYCDVPFCFVFSTTLYLNCNSQGDLSLIRRRKNTAVGIINYIHYFSIV